MNLKRYLGLLLLFVMLGFESLAQVVIAYPSSRAVFQRDSQNKGFIPISGIGDADIIRVEARLLPVQSGQGSLTEWVVIDNSPKAGSFSGKFEGTAGWYVLQIRTFNAEGQSESTQVERIGIGEVFIISGQSNAQGLEGRNASGATEDRVNAYSSYNSENISETPPITGFYQLSRDRNIGPHGQTPWLWGEFGDRLVRELNVPVLFFNTAYEGTFASDWVRSSRGEDVYHSGFGFKFPGNTPYSFLGNVLKNHLPLMGARAVIWVQGENEGEFNISEDKYYSDLKELIEISRGDAGTAINWIVYRTSLIRNISHQRVINAQNRIISDLENVYAGPETDGLQVPRPDGVHLSNVPFGYPGLSEVASASWRQLGDFFFNTSVPTTSGRNGFEDLTIQCSNEDQVILSYPSDDVESIVWNGTNPSSSISALSGVYSATITDINGKVRFSKSVDVSKAFPSRTPRVNAVGNVQAACVGGSITYSVDDNYLPIVWQDNSLEETYTATRTEDVFAVYKNEFGCSSNRSNIARPQFVPKPEPPKIISVNNKLAACKGEAVQLTVLNAENVNLIWSTGETSKVIRIQEEGESSLSASISTSLGCNSEESESITVSILPTFSPPEIFQNGPYTLGVRFQDDVGSYEWFNEQSVIANDVASVIPPEDGLYRVKGFKAFTDLGISCPTEASGFYEFKKFGEGGLVVYPNPVPGDAFFLSSDETIEKVLMTMYDSRGRQRFSQTINNVDLPKEIRIKGKQYFGKHFLRLDYDGFYKVFPMVFE